MHFCHRRQTAGRFAVTHVRFDRTNQQRITIGALTAQHLRYRVRFLNNNSLKNNDTG